MGAKGNHGSYLVTRWDSLVYSFVILLSLVNKRALSCWFLSSFSFFALRRRGWTLSLLFGHFGRIWVREIKLEFGDFSFEIYVTNCFRLLEKLNFFFSFGAHHFLKVDYLLTQVFQLQVVGRLLLSKFALGFTFISSAWRIESLVTFLRYKSLRSVLLGCKGWRSSLLIELICVDTDLFAANGPTTRQFLSIHFI